MTLSKYEPITIRTAAILTGSYVAADVLGPTSSTPPSANNQLELECQYTKGSLTSVEIKIEFSQDGVTYCQETVKAVSGGTTTLSLNEYTTTASTGFVISVPITANYIKVSAKGTGTATGSSLAIIAKLAWR